MQATIKSDWIQLVSHDQLEEICLRSEALPVVILKHSTRCSISRFVLKDLVHSWNLPALDVPFYYLDLLNYRSISDDIALRFSVVHQSPQLLLICGQKCVFSETHDSISAEHVAHFLKMGV
jgi:bacillithiol system protein YtxJ